ncbi:MAG: hypothetical protein ACRERD_14110 [Candidatus Binatia bacterium]
MSSSTTLRVASAAHHGHVTHGYGRPSQVITTEWVTVGNGTFPGHTTVDAPSVTMLGSLHR